MSGQVHPVTTVLGPRGLSGEGLVDAHAHIWIAPVAGGAPDAPVLDDATSIRAELWRFAEAGGEALIDCQPPAAGRDARRLVELSAATGVAVVASTGFHLDRYYRPDDSPWRADPEQLTVRCLEELELGMTDGGSRTSARAGAIKAAHPGAEVPGWQPLFRAAATAAAQAGVLLVVHTERGAGVDELADVLLSTDLSSQDVMLCHVDKRPDLQLHRELAKAGFLLEYDTFLRPKYTPADAVWPLIDAMLADGREEAIACGLDLADASLWAFGGGSHGMTGLQSVVAAGLRERGADDEAMRRLLGANVRRRLQMSGTLRADR